MMYIDSSELLNFLSESELTELTDDFNDGVDEQIQTVIDSAISRASSIIDSYLSTRYNVPLTDVPESIKDACGVITRYKLISRRDGLVSEELIKEYDRVMNWLEKISSGSISLPSESNLRCDSISVGFADFDETAAFKRNDLFS